MTRVLSSRLRLLSAAGIAVATVATAFAAPSSARLVRAEPLGAVTTITATTSGTAELVLYDDATISSAYTHNPDVTISGKGRLVGFDLASANPSSTGMSTDELTAVRLPAFVGQPTLVNVMSTAPRKCSGYPNDTVPAQQECSGCSYTPSSQVPLQENCPYALPKFFKLHEGYYHLSVLTDGAPVQLTLRLHGIGKGGAKVHLQSSFRSSETSLPQQESIGTSTITYGGSTAFPNTNSIFTVVGVKMHPNATLLSDSLCWRTDTSAPPPYAYSAACPGGHAMSDSYRVMAPVGGIGAEGVGVFTGSLAPNTTPTSVGGSFVDSDGPTYVGGVAVWLDRDDLPFGSMLQAP